MLKFKCILLLLLFNFCFGKQFLIETKSNEEEVDQATETITDPETITTPEPITEINDIESELQALLEQDPATADQEGGIAEGAEPGAVAEAEQKSVAEAEPGSETAKPGDYIFGDRYDIK